MPSRPPPHAYPACRSYKQLAQAKEAPRLFPGAANKAEEVSPDRIHPYRLFYPGQLYAPQVRSSLSCRAGGE
jgi:hypothetical protein